MCLVIKKSQKAKVAKEDIPCVKILEYHHDEWYTPYQNAVITPGMTMHSKIVRCPQKSWSLKPDYTMRIDEGLHSFVPSAKESIKREFEFISANDCTLVNCIIPKGAKYYIGDYEDADDGYVSDTLVYPEEFPEVMITLKDF